MELVRFVAEVEAEEVVEGEGEALAFAQRRQERDRQRAEEEGGAEPAVRMDAEVEDGDAGQQRDAVGDDHEHQRVAVVALIEQAAFGAALVRFQEAREELSFAAAGTAAAQSAHEGGADGRADGGVSFHRRESQRSTLRRDSVAASAGLFFRGRRLLPPRMFNAEPIRIVHVITGLDPGGAERTMINVACGLDPRRFQSHVISLSRGYTLARVIHAAGIALTTLDAHPFRSLGVGPLWGVARALRRERPDIVQTWLLDADLVGGLAGKMTNVPVIWNIRASMSDSGWRPFAPSLRQRVVARVCEALSGLVPRNIISCSYANVTRSMRRYRQEKIRVIRNGVDTELFKPDPVARAEVRAELGVDRETPLIGMVARFHPVKDHATLLAAARPVSKRIRTSGFAVRCRRGAGECRAHAPDPITWHGGFVLRLGHRDDVPRIFAALDLHLFSSRSRIFGNVPMEAMAPASHARPRTSAKRARSSATPAASCRRETPRPSPPRRGN